MVSFKEKPLPIGIFNDLPGTGLPCHCKGAFLKISKITWSVIQLSETFKRAVFEISSAEISKLAKNES